MKNLSVIVAVVFALGVGYFLLMPKSTSQSQEVFVADKTFDVKGLNYAYDVKEIKVKLNDKVQINFTNTEGFHDFKIDEFGVATKQIKASASESVQFVANKAGTFEYYCSVGQHRANGMWGKLIVE
jgi:plastocyanin